MHLEPDSPYLADASGYRGHADELLLPEDEGAVVDIMPPRCSARRSL